MFIETAALVCLTVCLINAQAEAIPFNTWNKNE